MLRAYHRGDSSGGAPIRPARAAAIALAWAVLPALVPVSGVAAPVAPGGLLAERARELSPGPPNGDLAAGLEGWLVEGRDTPALLAPGARLAGNVTLVSPPVLLPPGAQTLRVALRAPGGGGLVRVRARPEDGAPEAVLADLEPGAARRSWPVPVPAALTGRVVRIVVDPVPALGTTIDVLRVGPVTAPLPGWTVWSGTLEVAGTAGRHAVTVAGAPLAIASPSYRIVPGPRRRTVSVGLRGDGVVRLTVAGRTAVRRAGPAWREVSVTLPRRGRTRIALRITATPGAGTLLLRDLGVVRRERARR